MCIKKGAAEATPLKDMLCLVDCGCAPRGAGSSAGVINFRLFGSTKVLHAFLLKIISCNFHVVEIAFGQPTLTENEAKAQTMTVY